MFKIEADSLCGLRSKRYQNDKIFRDSIISFRRGKKFGLFNIKENRELDIWSDEPFTLSDSRDVFVFTEGKLKGAYHLPSGKTIEAQYKYISAIEQRALKGKEPFFDFAISCTINKEVWEMYFLKEKKIYTSEEIDGNLEGFKKEYRVARDDGKSTLLYSKTRRKALPSSYNSIKTILNEDESLKYVRTEQKRQGIQYLNDQLELITPENDNWVNARLIDSNNEILLVKKKKGKLSWGIFDLKKQRYVVEPNYCQIKLFRNQLVSLRGDKGFAIADLEGNILSDFIYYKIHESLSNAYLIAERLEDNKQVCIDEKGQKVFPNGFASISSVTMYPDSSGVHFCVKEDKSENSPSRLIDSDGKKILDLPEGYTYQSLDGPLDMIFKQGMNGFHQYLVKDLSTQAISEDGDIYSRISVLEKRDGHFFYQLPTKEKNYLYDSNGSLLFTFSSDKELALRKSRNEEEHNHYFVIKPKGYLKDPIYDAYDLNGNLLVKGYSLIRTNTANKFALLMQ